MGWLQPVIAGTAKYGPKIGSFAVKKLPWITGGMGALSQSDRGLGGMLQGGVVGATTGMGVGGPLTGVMRPAAVRMAGLASKAGLSGPALGAVAGVTRAAIPVGAGLGLGAMSAGLGGAGISAASGGAGNVLGAGAGQLTKEGNLVPMSSLPEGYQPNANNMVRGPQGNWWYYYNPGGVPAGNRLNRQLDAITSASNINTLGNAMFGQTERKERANFERQAAAEQLAANIEQAKKMALTSQEGGIRMGMDANKAVAEAMSNRGNFNYF